MTHNTANQLQRATLGSGPYWQYAYGARGNVETARKSWGDNTPVAGQQFEYVFDDIGNRLVTRTGGDNAGANLRVANYSPTILNGIQSRDIPGVVDVIGTANPAASVKVNGQPVTLRGNYFRAELAVNNALNPAFATISVQSLIPHSDPTAKDIISESTGNTYPLPRHPESSPVLAYDFDGNLISDGLWTYTWDFDNRLTAMESIAAVPDSAKRKLLFEYDHLGRRTRKRVFMWNSGAPGAWSSTPITDVRFIYDGWNLIAELDGLNGNARLRSYVWGLDLSGSKSGAGGIGGLLAVRDASGAFHSAVHDGHGNIVALVASDGTVTARYEYGPFGEGLRATGPMAQANPIRFSSKYTDVETGLIYFGYRYYDPVTGRFLNRDPMGVAGGLNLYAFVHNDPLNYIDPDGRFWRYGWAYTSGFAEGLGQGAMNLGIGAGKLVKAVTFDLGQQITFTAFDIYGAHYGGEDYQFESAIFRGTHNMALEGAGSWQIAEEGALQISGYRFGNQIHSSLEEGAATGDYSHFSQNMGCLAAMTAGPKAVQTARTIEVPGFRGQGVRTYEVGPYESLQERSLPRDGLDLDHQPSHSSNIARAEAELGRRLTPAEIEQIRRQGTAVAVPEDWHRSHSPTYGGRNTPTRIQADAADPLGAATRDSAAMIDGCQRSARGGRSCCG